MFNKSFVRKENKDFKNPVGTLKKPCFSSCKGNFGTCNSLQNGHLGNVDPCYNEVICNVIDRAPL